MTEPAIKAISRVRHSARPSVGKQRLRRLAATAIGDIATSAEAVALTPLAMGAVAALCLHLAQRQNLEELGSNIALDEVRGVLAARGMTGADAEVAVSALLASKVLAMNEGVLALPGFEAVLSKHLQSFANRAEGWDRRSAPAVERSARPVLELVAPVQGSLVPEAPVAALSSAPAASPAKASAAKRKAPARGAIYRLGGEKDDFEPASEDLTVARVESECGGVAEITQSRIDHLQTVFPRVDVLEQVRLAAAWVQGQPQRRKTLRGTTRFLFTWLSTASDRARMRADQAAIGNERNGFGQGGQYGGHRAEVPAAAPSADDDFADLAAFEEGASVVEADAVPAPAPAASSRVSPLAAARARLSQRDASPAHPMSVAPQRQRRLSEQLR